VLAAPKMFYKKMFTTFDVYSFGAFYMIIGAANREK
jgi:hypothetical protein